MRKLKYDCLSWEHISNGYVNPWDLLNNFCFYVLTQKLLFVIKESRNKTWKREMPPASCTRPSEMEVRPCILRAATLPGWGCNTRRVAQLTFEVVLQALGIEIDSTPVSSIPLADYKDDLYTFEDDSEDNLYPWKTTSIDENCANKTKSPIITGKEDTEQQ